MAPSRQDQEAASKYAKPCCDSGMKRSTINSFLSGCAHAHEQYRRLVDAVRTYQQECETVAPDALYKRKSRENVFAALHKLEADACDCGFDRQGHVGKHLSGCPAGERS